MCTAVFYKTTDSYFGRTLDLEHTYREEVVVTPRDFMFRFQSGTVLQHHHAMIGMATVAEGYPLYYEAANEHGLAVAGLNFPNNAHYFPKQDGQLNVAPFELIPWLLSCFCTVDDVRRELRIVNLCDIPFSEEFPLSPLHWMIADKRECIVLECTKNGLAVYDNPVGVLTNNPPFDYHITHLNEFISLTPNVPDNRFGPIPLATYSRGMGALGLPGDLSSASRFVRAAFVRANSVAADNETDSVSQFFHILGAVEQQRGCVRLPNGGLEITQYTSCINQHRGIYYYTTYGNQAISAVDMHRCKLDSTALCRFPLIKEQQITCQNGTTTASGPRNDEMHG